MNYLAHAYLSFDNPEILTGNLISDFVKGKKKLDYPPVIQQGIVLHRDIDTFTDTHDATRRAKVYFRAAYGLYSGALTDIVYDHFLANDPAEFPTRQPFSEAGSPKTASPQGGSDQDQPRDEQDPLASFAARTYTELAPFAPLFPDKFARMFPYMRSQNWLYHYRFKDGIFSSFSGLARRAAYMPDPSTACRIFEDHYLDLKACYDDFFPALKAFALSDLRELAQNSGSGKS